MKNLLSCSLLLLLMTGWGGSPITLAQNIAADPVIQQALRNQNFEPGGQFFPGLQVRGDVIPQTRSGKVNVIPGPAIPIGGGLALQQGTISGIVRYTVDIGGHHPASVHSPFDSIATEQGTFSDRNLMRAIQFVVDVRGTLNHPANGYDAPQGGGYPQPSRFGAIDLYTMNVTGQIEGLFRQGFGGSGNQNPLAPNRPGYPQSSVFVLSSPNQQASAAIQPPGGANYPIVGTVGDFGYYNVYANSPFSALSQSGYDPRFSNLTLPESLPGAMVVDAQEKGVSNWWGVRDSLVEISDRIDNYLVEQIAQNDFLLSLGNTSAYRFVERNREGLSVVGDLALSMSPLGWAIDLRDFDQAISQGDTLDVAIAAMGFIPLVGDLAKQAKHVDNITESFNSVARRDAFDALDGWSREPKSLMDKMVLDAAKDGKGSVIVPKLGDSRFLGMEKWSYGETSANGLRSEVHYVRDPTTGKLMDFKFKQHAETAR